MGRPEQELLDRLGDDGLRRVLGDLLDQNGLVRLANACGLEYRGMRTRSQSRKRVLDDLVGRAVKNAATRRAIYRVLEKETRTEFNEWVALTAEEKARRLGDETFLSEEGNLGRHLFFLARADGDADGFESLLARQQLLRIAENGHALRTAPKTSRTETRLQKKITQLEKKIVHFEKQLTRTRESERSFKRDLIQRKGELAESRMLAERVGRELVETQAALRQASSARRSEAESQEGLSKLGRAVRKLASEQRKLLAEIDRVRTAPAQAADASHVEPLAESVRALQKELSALRRDHKRELQERQSQIDVLRAQIKEQAGLLRALPQPRRRGRVKSSELRVGVFIDVQNVYYGARRLKGKLDFDALLQAAVLDRRLIQATAYVVESKEIDQSGFIALLQQRGIEVRRKTLQVRADGSTKGDWDMELALDVLDGAPDLDVAVLVSGDGDFTSLVKRVKKIGPRVEVLGFPRTTAKSLIVAADRFEPLDRKFMIYKRPPRSGDETEGRRSRPQAESARAPRAPAKAPPASR